MCESMIRTFYYCIIFCGAFCVSSYMVDLNKRVIALEERVEHGLVIPLPLDLNRFRFRLIEGEPTQ